ncbi:MAG: MarR family transcriptional regulator [Bermanella sp.]
MYGEDQFIILLAKLKDRAYEFIQAELKRLDIEGAPSHGAILVALLHYKQLSLTELSKIIDKKKSSTTELVDKLIKIGYVEKTIDVHDQRIKLVQLTKKSMGLKSKFAQFTKNLTNKTFQGVSEKEKQQTILVMDKILKNFEG